MFRTRFLKCSRQKKNVQAILFAFFLFFLFSEQQSVHAQQGPHTYPSLLKGKPAAVQIDLLDSLASESRKSEPEQAEYLLRLSIAIASENKLDSLQTAQRIALARFLRGRGDNEAAAVCLDTAILLARKNNFSKMELVSMNQKGLALTKSGDYVNASQVFIDAIKIAEAKKDTNMLAILEQHSGAMYFYMENLDKAIEHSKAALESFVALHDSESIASNLDNIGLYYSNKQEYDSAYLYQLKALGLFAQLQDTFHLMICYNNMGALLTKTKKYGEAESFLNKSLLIAELKNDQYRVLTSLTSLADLYTETGENQKAIDALTRAYAISVQLKDNFYAHQSSRMLGELYYRDKNYERSAYYFRISDGLQSKVYDEQKAKAVDEISQKYETEQRKKRIELLQAEKRASDVRIERDRLLKIIFVVIAVALLFFSLITVRRYIRKKNDNRVLHEKNEAIASQKKLIEVKNREILDSISYATRIQNAVLPSADRVHSLFPQSFIYYRPRDIISGDFFWIGSGQNGINYLAVADCTGHGVPGALMSMLGSSLLNQILTKENIQRPGQILDLLHERLIRMLNESAETRSINDGMDIALLMHDPVRKKVVIASADRPVYIVRNEKLEIILPDKISIGSTLAKTEAYRENEITIDTPVQFYLFSDGITDQFGGSQSKKFMSKRLQALISANAGLPIGEREAIFVKTVDEWKSGSDQTDDMTLIHLTIN